jgi:lysophospholipase L1-like esterase
MSRFSRLLRGAIGLGAIAGIASCGDADSKVLGPVDPTGGALFKTYVSIGNSITAGYQSGGINDSVQRQSYAVLFAQQAGTRFAYPSFVKAFPTPTTPPVLITSGCPPLLGNWFTQKLTDSLAPTPNGCLFRDPTKVTDVLNNVAVPGAYAHDLLVTGSTGLIVPNNTLQTLILGGKAQIDVAIAADPTFVSFWIGNNETLLPAEAGMLGGPGTGSPAPPLIPAANEIPDIKAALDSLVKGAKHLKGGIIIGAAKVTSIPHFFSADTMLNATRKGQFDTFTGKGSSVVLGCGTTAKGWLISADLPKQIKAGTHPNLVSCGVTPAAPAPVGDIFMLDPTEQANLNATTDAYNVYLKAKADTLGWAYLDPNVILAALRTGTGATVPAWPTLTSATRDASTAVFGIQFSLDGVHPSQSGQKVIANAMIDSVNAKYGPKGKTPLYAVDLLKVP